jgi:hypothetical protein
MSKNKIANRARELEFFLNFIKAAEMPSLSWHQLTSDPPDFIFIDKHDNVIGIEIRELHATENQKESEEHFKTIIKYAELEFAKLSDEKICVSFQFNQRIQCSKLETQKLGSVIAEWIFGHLDKYHQLTNHSHQFENLIKEIPAISEIKLIKCDGCCKDGWKYDRGLVFGLVCQLDILSTAIGDKANQISKWNSKFLYHEKWLLLVETGETSSVFSSFPTDQIDWSKYNKFDKAFVFNSFLSEIIETIKYSVGTKNNVLE